MILVVEDSKINQKAVANLLEGAGFETVVAESGQECLDHLKKEIPELILLDVMLPGINGFEVCKRIKADPRVSHIPVIFITSISDTDAIVSGFKLGAVDYVTKPFRNLELLARVQTHLELHRARKTIVSSEETIRNLKTLLPVCSYCGVLRDEDGEWLSMKDYFTKNLEKSASHSICPHCMNEYHPDIAEAIRKKHAK